MLSLLALSSSAVAFRIPQAHGPVPEYEERFFRQQLDHFHPESHAVWDHRYLFSDKDWDGKGKLKNGCKGPILLYTGNEGPIDAFWGISGFVNVVLAKKLGALVVFPEERYYGKSLPFGAASYTAENLVYLTTEQILEDYIAILDHLKSTLPGAANCPVIAFGGSYGGTLTTFIRVKYPAAIAGGLAASAPVGYYDPDHWAANGVTEYTWSDIVNKDYTEADPQCMPAIQATIEAIAAAPVDDLVKTFHLCDKTGLGPDADKPFELFQYALESIPQQDYPYAIGSHPAWPVNATCKVLVAAFKEAEAEAEAEAKAEAARNKTKTSKSSSASSLLLAAQQIIDLYIGYDGTNCIPTAPEGPGGVPGDGPGPGNWGYQSCTENLHQFSGRKGGVREYKFDYNATAKYCQQVFNGTVKPDPMALTHIYGGFQIPTSGVSNLIFSNGKLDPWHGGGFLKPGDPSTGNHWILMEKGAHHLDLRGPHPEDPTEITAARVKEAEIISGWIKDYAAKDKDSANAKDSAKDSASASDSISIRK